MARIVACIDGSVYSGSVADHTGWAAMRLGAEVELLQVLGRGETASQDRSGRIVPGARRQLLEELAALDGERAKLLQQQGRFDLEEARTRIEATGVSDVTASLRYGDLLEALAEREPNADLVVVGKRGEAADFAKLHLGSNLERMLRAARLPVLIAARAFRPIERLMIAFDGRSSALKAVAEVSRSPLFKGLEAMLVSAGERTATLEAKVDAAAADLRAAGLAATVEIIPGPAIKAIPEATARERIDLVVMGAYGHSRLRTLAIGSTTSEVIRDCLVPILVYR
ncbi:MAG: universal stress protein [Pseudomonadota bacterium]